MQEWQPAGKLVGAMINYFNHSLDFFIHVDVFICPSVFSRDRFIEFKFKPEKLLLIRYLVDLPENLDQEAGKYGIYIGRREREKGVYLLLKALEDTDIPLKFIGDGSAKQELLRRAEKRNLRKVEFTGFKTGEELKSLVSGALFAVVPSLVYGEKGETLRGICS